MPTTTKRSSFTDQELEFFRQERLAKLAAEGRIRLVPCEYCGAAPGENCRSVEGAWESPVAHAVRRAQAGL